MKLNRIVVLSLLAANVHLATQAQMATPEPIPAAAKAPENWFNLDRSESQITGVSTEKAYELLKNKPSKTVTVAVIDGGIDVKHEDLQGKIWVNEKEIPGNGVDDDKNGYVDDINGWNFIGGKDGKNVNNDSYELTRQYAALRNRFEGKKVRRRDKADYEKYLKVKETFEEKIQELKGQAASYKNITEAYRKAHPFLKTYLGKDTLTAESVAAITSTDEKVQWAKKVMEFAFENKIDEKELKEAEEYFDRSLNYGYNPDFDPRNIVGDNYSNLKEKGYGNNDVKGPDAKHGTHVAGIIAANRANSLGMKGVADNVKIMAIRAVPNGDERDKDIANAIRYAVDNGAQIINMSFGKDYSPQKQAVDEAVQYAASKGVLLVHAAGNDSKDIDAENNFPSKKLLNGKTEITNWLEIGASSWGAKDKFVGISLTMVKTVDVFAPGVDVYSTTPESKYESLSGTSMAAPVTSGVAALVLSYYPQLTAAQLKDILTKSSVKFNGVEVNKPGEKGETVAFDNLSITGGVVNAYEAVKAAEDISKQN